MADVDVETIAVLAGLKPALRRAVDPAGEERARQALSRHGLTVLRAARLATFGAREVVVLYAARTEADAAALREAEAPVLPGVPRVGDGGAAHLEVGRRLGFPPCCVEAFCARLSRGVDTLPDGTRHLAEDYVALRAAWVAAPDPRLNPLCMPIRRQLVSHYPCRYDCAPSSRYAAALAAELTARAPDAAAALLAELARSVAVAPDGSRARVELDGSARITGAQPMTPADASFAASLASRTVGPDGAVSGDRRPPPWVVRFGG